MLALWHLFSAYFRVGLFAIGGAYTLIPLIERETVDHYHWLTEEEFLHLLGVTQSIPGAISIKFATYTGYKIAGIPGVIAANLGHMVPPILAIALLLAVFERVGASIRGKAFLAGIKAGTWGLIFGFALTVARQTEWNTRSILLGVLAFLGIALLDLHPALVILGAGLLGVLLLI